MRSVVLFVGTVTETLLTGVCYVVVVFQLPESCDSVFVLGPVAR